MKKVISYIRDLKQIEEELIGGFSGVIAFQLDNEKIHQIASNFIYVDKNIYVFLQIDEEIYQKIKFGTAGSFTVHGFDKKIKKHDLFAESTYRLKSVTINGIVREVDDKKLIDQIIENYRNKYSDDLDMNEYNNEKNLKPVIIDTEEMTAFIEEGN